VKIERFEDIEGWQLGRQLAQRIYTVSTDREFSRDFALRDQIRRAAGSIMHNIAEGFDGGSNPEFIRFLGYAKRSCTEVQSQLYVALDQEYISNSEFEGLFEMSRLTRSKIGAFIKYLSDFENERKRSAGSRSQVREESAPWVLGPQTEQLESGAPSL
jgi:four helix bundle protein